MPTDKTQPAFTFRADVDETGEAFLPECFADGFQRLTAALDWARVYAQSFSPTNNHLAAVELEAAADAADVIAGMARRLAATARAGSSLASSS